MKKIVYLCFAVFLSVSIISSCKKDDKVGAEKFSPLSIEQNKASVEDAGIELVTTMSDMKSIESVDILVNLGDILSSMGSKKAIMSKDSKLFSTLATFTDVAKGDKKVNDLFDAMAYAKELGDDGPESIKEIWDSIVGTYTWMPDLNDFDRVSGGNSAIFKFPSSDVSSTNDATLTIFNYKGIVIANPLDDDYTGDLPTALEAQLKVGATTYVSYVFAASYNTDGVPNAITSNLTIESYKFEIDITNSTSSASVNYKFLADSKVIMDLGASGKGLFTEKNYDDNTSTSTITHTETYGYWDYQLNPVTGNWDPIWVTYTDTWDETRTETEFEEILNSAAAHFQLFDIAVRGDVDVKGLVDEIRKIDDNVNLSGDEADSLVIIQINKYINLRLVKVSTNEIMAKAQAYLFKEMNTEYEDSYIDFRLTFNDGSLVDAETYFNEGFGSFIDELNALINDLNNEYTLDLVPVEY
jgi:hypothetical protein